MNRQAKAIINFARHVKGIENTKYTMLFLDEKSTEIIVDVVSNAVEKIALMIESNIATMSNYYQAEFLLDLSSSKSPIIELAIRQVLSHDKELDALDLLALLAHNIHLVQGLPLAKNHNEVTLEEVNKLSEETLQSIKQQIEESMKKNEKWIYGYIDSIGHRDPRVRRITKYKLWPEPIQTKLVNSRPKFYA